MNSIHLIGRLGKDPEVKYTNSGKAVCNLSIATGSGDYVQWHRVTLWEKNAELAGQWLSKGTRIGIDGELRYREYDKDGAKHRVAEIHGHRMHFADAKPQQQRQQTGGFPEEQRQQAQQQGQSGFDYAPPSMDDDVPF